MPLPPSLALVYLLAFMSMSYIGGATQSARDRAVSSWSSADLSNNNMLDDSDNEAAELSYKGLQDGISVIPSSDINFVDRDGESETSPQIIVNMDQTNATNDETLCLEPEIGHVNCSFRKLTKPSNKWPRDITIYDLSNNLIQSIQEGAFSRYSNLQKLDLHNNLLCKVFNTSFSHLSNLEELDLSWNKLVMKTSEIQSTYPDGVFKPLRKLRVLRLHANNPRPSASSMRYPSKALSVLSSLTELSLDGLENATFDENFSHLTSLVNLSLSGMQGCCEIRQLRNDTFQFVRQLKHLNISNCGLVGHLLGKKAFTPLGRLESLDISDNGDISIQYLQHVFFGLTNTTSFKTLAMDRVTSTSSLRVCLTSDYLKYFPRSVENLSVVDNRIECVDRNVMATIGTNLKFLDVSKNPFLFGTYLLDLPKLRKLNTLQMINQENAKKLPDSYPQDPQFTHVNDENCSLYAKQPSDEFRDPVVIYLPPSLRKVFIMYADYNYILSRLKIDSDNILDTLVLERNYITRLEGPISGLLKIRNFTVIGAYLRSIKEDFFNKFTSLKILDLSENYLGSFLAENPNSEVFRPLVKLTHLDLSLNSIEVLGKDIFKNLNKLKFLNLSRNPKLTNLYIDVSPFVLRHFRHLILDNTHIGTLPKQTRQLIDFRFRYNHTVHVSMENCPILCSCENLQFLRWMARSPAFKLSGENVCYWCVYPDQSIQHIWDNYTGTIATLSSQCSLHKGEYFIVGSATTLCLIALISILVYRYRWKLRYIYYAGYLQLKSNRDTTSGESTFLHDVFVCYAECDSDFVIDTLAPALESRGITVFIHSRDFAAGEFIGSSIVRAVRTCRRTLVVLTRSYAASAWSSYEIQMANMESANRGSPVLIFLLADSLAENEMSVDLLYNVRNNTYVQLPSGVEGQESEMQKMWNKLTTDIRN